MTSARMLVPILGGTALIVGGIAALICDRLDLRADPMEPRPIWIRYTSQATYALKARSHWIFLMALCIFSPCLLVTAQWQASLATTNSSNKGAIVFHATMCALGGFGVALLPMGNVLGTIIHMVTAGCFAAFGINYAFQAWTLAGDRGNDFLASIRSYLAVVGIAGAVVTMFSVYPAVSGTEALAKHKTLLQKHGQEAISDMEGFLTPRQCLWARLGELSLAVGQISIAIAMAVTLLTGAVEAGDVQDSPDVAWIVGVAASLAMLALAAIFYTTNTWWYATCQATKEEEEIEEKADVEEQPTP